MIDFDKDDDLSVDDGDKKPASVQVSAAAQKLTMHLQILVAALQNELLSRKFHRLPRNQKQVLISRMLSVSR